MKVCRTRASLLKALNDVVLQGTTVGFVATMGALHEGHLSLLRAARDETDVVVVSIFVNPLQFGPSEDYAAYARDEARDLKLVEQEKSDVVFVPGIEEMYPQGGSTTVGVGELGKRYEGAARPGHFDGVCTVVSKLFNLVRPDRAFFGQKDAQQVAVLRRMVRDLFFPVEIVVGPTIREHDGLAASSRNVLLSAAERQKAPTLYGALKAGRDALASEMHPEAAEKAMLEALRAASIEPDYASAVDPDTFGPTRPGRPVLLVVAARLGGTRLIDNLLIET